MAGGLDPAVAAVRRAVRSALADVDPGRSVLVACSGGADSLALAAATLFEGTRFAWDVAGLVVDHGLQQRSAEVADGVVSQLLQLGCQAQRVSVRVAGEGGPEAAAREARYDALSAAAAPADSVVLLGHTRDDQAETVLLGLVRGSGTRSLAGMPPVSGRFRRPLLDVTREQTHQACAALGLTVWEDPHNLDPRFTRVRVRHRVLPVLERELGPGVSAALARTARLAREDAETLDAMAQNAYTEAEASDGVFDVSVLAATPAAVRRRVLRSAAVRAGSPAGELFGVHIRALDALVADWHGQRGADLPGSVTARRSGSELRFEKSPGR